MLERGALASLILWGPPGVGKTTIARLLAEEAGLRFTALSAVFSGVADLKRAFDEARMRHANGQSTLLFVDEIHRFNRAQQDGFLPVVEDGTVVLVGATTENPSFALNGALLSRCQVMVLKRLDDAALELLLTRAEEEGGQPLPVDEEARATLRAMADGDGRYLLNLAAQLQSLPADTSPMDVAGLSSLLAKRAALYDKDAEEHHGQWTPTLKGERGSQVNHLLSAFHKSLRGSDVQAALYYAARLIVLGEDTAPMIWRRLACAASEDVGMADPQAMVQAITGWTAYQRIGPPEGRLMLAQAISYVATAPKSNAAHIAFNEALEAAERTAKLSPPLHVLNAHTKLLADLGHGVGYRYDHDERDAFSGQEFFPEPLAGPNRPDFYRPNERGFERDVKRRMDFWNMRRGQPETD
jgi:putative ATPase